MDEFPKHEMQTEYEHNGLLVIVCPECGRKVYLVDGEPAIYEPGDQWASHHWGADGFQISVEVS